MRQNTPKSMTLPLKCTSTPKLVPDGGLLTEHMAVANTKDLGTSVAMLVHVLMEEQCDTPLSIIGLTLLSSNRHAECSSQEVTKVVGGVDVSGDIQKWWI